MRREKWDPRYSFDLYVTICQLHLSVRDELIAEYIGTYKRLVSNGTIKEGDDVPITNDMINTPPDHNSAAYRYRNI